MVSCQEQNFAANAFLTCRLGKIEPDRVLDHDHILVRHKVGAFGVIVADVHTCRPLIDMVRAAVAAARLQSAGHLLVDHNPDVIVSGDLARFEVTTTVSSPLPSKICNSAIGIIALYGLTTHLHDDHLDHDESNARFHL